jgi:hypothetical protein
LSQDEDLAVAGARRSGTGSADEEEDERATDGDIPRVSGISTENDTLQADLNSSVELAPDRRGD